MVLVVYDSKLGNVRELQDFELDLAFGSDENSFELTCAAADAPSEGQFAFIDGGEYGGVVDELRRRPRCGGLRHVQGTHLARHPGGQAPAAELRQRVPVRERQSWRRRRLAHLPHGAVGRILGRFR